MVLVLRFRTGGPLSPLLWLDPIASLFHNDHNDSADFQFRTIRVKMRQESQNQQSLIPYGPIRVTTV